ncbi:MAG: GntR family transcriptional regulator [Cypionkella sp.]
MALFLAFPQRFGQWILKLETTEMDQIAKLQDRRTSVDMVFDHLYEQIVSLQLLPGDKISEADIAARFGVSRQPVRDAFSRLDNLDLLLIRPQKATEVKRFSTKAITKSRFIRAAVEADVLRRAVRHCDAAGERKLNANLAKQAAVVKANNYDGFGPLDYDFHKLLCEIALVDFAFEIISTEKAQVDRLCMLGLSKEARMPELLEDHRTIAEMLVRGNAQGAVEAGMLHLSRLDATIAAISKTNPGYFDP